MSETNSSPYIAVWVGSGKTPHPFNYYIIMEYVNGKQPNAMGGKVSSSQN